MSGWAIRSAPWPAWPSRPTAADVRPEPIGCPEQRPGREPQPERPAHGQRRSQPESQADAHSNDPSDADARSNPQPDRHGDSQAELQPDVDLMPGRARPVLVEVHRSRASSSTSPCATGTPISTALPTSHNASRRHDVGFDQIGATTAYYQTPVGSVRQGPGREPGSEPSMGYRAESLGPLGVSPDYRLARCGRRGPSRTAASRNTRSTTRFHPVPQPTLVVKCRPGQCPDPGLGQWPDRRRSRSSRSGSRPWDHMTVGTASPFTTTHP